MFLFWFAVIYLMCVCASVWCWQDSCAFFRRICLCLSVIDRLFLIGIIVFSHLKQLCVVFQLAELLVMTQGCASSCVMRTKLFTMRTVYHGKLVYTFNTLKAITFNLKN